ncbi:MAG: hypothetical protein IT370_19205 [Deltaproteobacteria bacterium]|nr:hypothetical protein [Deltaproteobacteria bacterium]
MTWSNELERFLRTYFADEGITDGVDLLVGESRDHPATFPHRALALLQQAIDAATAGDHEVAAALHRGLGGDLEPLSAALEYLEEVKATFLQRLSELPPT